MRKELIIKNQMQELERVSAFVEGIVEELKLGQDMLCELQLVMEEMVVNVISYAYPEGTVADITLIAESDGTELTFVISDKGKEFDPTQQEDADMSINPAEREIGGMGIFIVRRFLPSSRW